jgi:hypothetical protein
MSDIKIGDLVMIVRPRPCCNNTDKIGHPFTVELPIDRKELVVCRNCGHKEKNDHRFVKLSGGSYCFLSRLKKIEPLKDHEVIADYFKVPV